MVRASCLRVSEPARLRRAPLRHVLHGSLAVMTLLIGGCLAQQRAAERLIDPALRADGELVVGQIDGDAQLVLGRHRVVDLEIREESFDGTGPLGPDERGRTRPTQQVRLELRLVGGQHEWTAECIGQRRQPGDQDFAAAADENRDEVAIACQLAGNQARWSLRASGKLGVDVSGQLVELPNVEQDSEPSARSERSFDVRLRLGHELWNAVPRPLPTPLLEVRSGGRWVAAMIFAEPERVWLSRDLVVSEGEPILTMLAALRLIPIGWEG